VYKNGAILAYPADCCRQFLQRYGVTITGGTGDRRSRDRLRAAPAGAPWASCSHTCASVTKQYNLEPVKGQWRSLAGQVTAGLVERSQPTIGFMSVTCGPTAFDRDQLRPYARYLYGIPLPLPIPLRVDCPLNVFTVFYC